MRVDIRTHLDLFDVHRLLVLARFGGFLLGLILVLAIVHDLGDRRLGSGRHLNQIKTGLVGHFLRAVGRDDAYIFAFGINQADFWNVDLVIGARPFLLRRGRHIGAACDVVSLPSERRGR